jgi:hypothetical protein
VQAENSENEEEKHESLVITQLCNKKKKERKQEEFCIFGSTVEGSDEKHSVRSIFFCNLITQYRRVVFKVKNTTG